MKLLVDSGSTKADWIAIDDNGKVLFTTQSLGLNPEVLNKKEEISINDNFFSLGGHSLSAVKLAGLITKHLSCARGCGRTKFSKLIGQVS